MAYNYLQDMPKQGSMDSFIGGYDIGLQRKKNQAIDNDNKALADILRGDTNAITRLQSPELIQKAQNHLRELEQRKALQGFYTPATKDQYQANVTQNPIAAIMDGGKKPSNLVQSQQPSFQESQAPTMLDMLQTGKIASGKPASYDVEGAGNYLLGQANFDQLGKLTDYRKAIAKDESEWGTNPTKGINPDTMKPDSYITDRKGNIKWLGSGVYEASKPQSAPVTWDVENNRVKTKYGYDAKGNVIVLGRSSMDAPQSIKQSRDPVDTALKIAEGKEQIKTDSEQRKTVAGKYADAAEVIPLLDGYIAALEKTPANFAMSMIYKGKGLVSDDNPELQAVSMANQKAKTLINYAQKQPGPSTDADVRNYLDQVGIASDITMPRDARLAAAKSARDFAKTIVKKFGNYASKILTGEITPEELQNLQPDQPQKPKAADRLNDLKEYRANRARYAKDPTALRILDEQARADGLIK